MVLVYNKQNGGMCAVQMENVRNLSVWSHERERYNLSLYDVDSKDAIATLVFHSKEEANNALLQLTTLWTSGENLVQLRLAWDKDGFITGMKQVTDKVPKLKTARGGDWHQKARELYNDGYNDREISEALQLSIAAISQWRRKNGLQSIQDIQREGTAPLWYETARALYDKGMSDQEISRELSVSNSTVCIWRKKNGLPANGHKPPAWYQQAMTLYQEGKSDQEIAQAVGKCRHAIWNWRKKRGLPNINSEENEHENRPNA